MGTQSNVLDFFNAEQSVESVSPNQLDFSTANEAFGDLAGFNVEKFQTGSSSLDGVEEPQDQSPTTTETTKPVVDLNSLYLKQKQANDDFGKQGAKRISAGSQNPYLAAAQYEFDQYATNVDRYRGYGQEVFNKIGFNPLGDNEDNYNQNTSHWQDFKRMTGQYGALFNSAFFSNYRSIAEFFTGDESGSVLDGDLIGARAFDKAMALGMSSKGGFRAGVTNFALNTAYTAGIAANIFFEETVLAAASVLSGGGAAPVAGARTLQNVARFGKAVKQGFLFATRGKEVGGMFKGGYQMLKSLKHLDNSRAFYQGIRTGAITFGKGAINFFNPLRGTTDLIRTSPTTFKSMSNFAKMSKGAGAFYRDVRENWFALSESQLEGGTAKQTMIDELIAEHIRKNDGQMPDQETLNRIYETADNAGKWTTLINIPLIFTSNRFVFDGLFNFKGVRALTEAAEDFGGKGLAKNWKFDLGSRTFVKAGEGFLQSTKSVLKNPKIWAGTFLNYTKANFAEGLQEVLQEVTSGAVRNYYKNTYADPTLGGYNYAMASAFSSLGDNAFSGQGFHTFLSGFAMGAPMRGMSKLATKGLTGISELYMKKVTPQRYEIYKKQKQQAEEVVGNALKKMISNPDAFFSRKRESLVNQKRANDNMLLAQSKGDNKAYHDAKDDKTFDSVFTALHNGSFDMLINAFEDMKGLSDKELSEAFNLEEGTKAKEKLNEYIDRAKEIKKNFDYFQEQYPNPFHPDKFGADQPDLRIKEIIGYKAFEDAKKTAILSRYGFERSLERMNGIMQNLLSDPFIAEAQASDFTALQNKQSIKDEIKFLRNEIKSLKDTTDPEQKKVLKGKEKKLEALEEYLVEFEEFENNRGKDEVNERGQIVTPFNEKTESLKKAFYKYARVVANIRNSKYVFNDKVDNAFNSILDYYNLDKDSKRFADVVNALLDPETLLKHANAINDALLELYEKRNEIAEKSIKGYLSIVELDALMTALGRIGVIIDPDQVEDLLMDGKIPTRFYDLKRNVVVDESDARYDTVVEIVQSFLDLRNDDKKPKEQPPVEQAATPETVKEKPQEKVETKPQPKVEPTPAPKPVVTEKLDAELEKRLRAAYDEFKQFQPDSDMTFEEYIAPEEEGGSAKANTIRNNYNLEKQKASGVKPVEQVPEVKPAPITVTPAAPEPSVSDQKVKYRREDFPDTQANTRTAVTQKLLDYFAEVVGIDKFTEDLSKGTYISWLQNTNPTGYEVSNTLNSPKKAFDIIAKYEQQLAAQKATPAPVTPAPVSDVELKRAELEKAQDEVNRLVNLRASDPVVAKAINDVNNKKISLEELVGIEENWNDKNGLTAAIAKFDQIKKELAALEGAKPAEVKPEPVKAEPVATPAPAVQRTGPIFSPEVQEIIDEEIEFYKNNNYEKDLNFILNDPLGYLRKKIYTDAFTPNQLKFVKADLKRLENYGITAKDRYSQYDQDLIKQSYEEQAAYIRYGLEERAREKLLEKTKKPLFGKKPEPSKEAIAKEAYRLYEIGVIYNEPYNSSELVYSVWDFFRGFDQKFGSSGTLPISRDILPHTDKRETAGETSLYKYHVVFNVEDGTRVLNLRVPVLVKDTSGNNRPAKYASISMLVPDFLRIDDFINEFFNEAKKLLGDVVYSGDSYRQKDFSPRDTRQVTTEDIKNLFVSIATKYLQGQDAGSQAAIVEQQVATPVVEKTGVQKAQDILNKIDKLTEIPNDKLTDENTNPNTKELLNLIRSSELDSGSLLSLVAAKKQELLKNLSAKDFENGYFVTFNDGRKGWVNSKVQNGLKMKMVGSEQGVYDIIPYNNLPNMVTMIEKNKKISPEPVKEIEITPNDKKAVEESKDTRQEFSKDIGKVQQSTNDAKEKSKDGVNNSFDDLINGLGCKTN